MTECRWRGCGSQATREFEFPFADVALCRDHWRESNERWNGTNSATDLRERSGHGDNQ